MDAGRPDRPATRQRDVGPQETRSVEDAPRRVETAGGSDLVSAQDCHAGSVAGTSVGEPMREGPRQPFVGGDGCAIGLLQEQQVWPMHLHQMRQPDPAGSATEEVPGDDPQSFRRGRGTRRGQGDSLRAGICWTDQVFPSGSLKWIFMSMPEL